MNTPQIDAAFVAEKLEAVGPVDLAAPVLLAQLLEMEQTGNVDPHAIVDAQGQIEQAVNELERHVKAVKGLVQKCRILLPSSTAKTPAGF